MFNNPIPVAVNIVLDESNNILIGSRKIEPFIGGNALIGGYVDQMENLETGAYREFKEETSVDISSFPLEYVTSKITANNRVLVFFKSKVPNLMLDNVPDSNEMSDIRWISMDELKKNPLCFELHQEVALLVLNNEISKSNSLNCG